tara:strand:- start:621 stop:809 length:189 start_codon:yes stop_codon:yes gene_type:complete
MYRRFAKGFYIWSSIKNAAQNCAAPVLLNWNVFWMGFRPLAELIQSICFEFTLIVRFKTGLH